MVHVLNLDHVCIYHCKMTRNNCKEYQGPSSFFPLALNVNNKQKKNCIVGICT